MISALVDHNLEGQADLLESALLSEGWVEMAVLRIVTFAEMSGRVAGADNSVGSPRYWLLKDYISLLPE